MYGFFGNQNKVSNLLVTQAKLERDARKKRISEAWQRYYGNHPKALKETKTDPDAKDNTSINYARKTVDIAAFYLFGKPLAFEVGESGQDTADTWLTDCWKANRQGTFLLEFATSAGVAGDGFIRLYPAGPGEAFPRMVSLDAATVDVDWEPSDYTRVIRYLVTFNAVDTEAARADAHRHRIERNGAGTWDIVEEVSKGDGKGWEVVSTEVWPYTFAPIFHCKNRPAPHCYYGTSDIESDVLDLNGAINFVISNINRILRVHGHPQLYISGQGKPDQIDRAVDSVLWLPHPESKVGSVPYVESLDSHFKQLSELRQAYHELTSIPEIATGKLENIGQLSGLALQILYGPLVQLVSVKRLFFGEMLMELCQAMLFLGRFGENLNVTIQWPQIIPTDRQAEAETALALNEAGVSKETTLKELGYKPEEEAAKKEKEGDAALELAMRRFDRGEGNGNPPNNQPPQNGANNNAN